MDWESFFDYTDEKPLDTLVGSYSNTSAFRKIAFIGDSLSSGEFETRDANGGKGYHDFYEYSWGQFIARKNGLEALNFSRGGMTAKEYYESFAEANGFWDEEKKCQAYVIALGVNDIGNMGMPLGSLEDIKDDFSENEKTFIGYYAAIISRYKLISPDAKFFLVGIPNDRLRPERCADNNGLSALLYGIAEKFSNCYFIDLYKYGPVIDESFEEKFYLYGHLNPSGYILFARIIDSYIDYIIRHNPGDFKNVGFINSGIDYQAEKGEVKK